MNSKLTSFLFLLLLYLFPFVDSNSQWVLGEKYLPSDASLYRTFRSKVEGGHYVVFQLTSGGNLELLLNSESGDADIYVSSKSKSPSADDYEFSSVTCASDSVFISEDQPRPVHISVFGSPYHHESAFTLNAYHISAKSSYNRIFNAFNVVTYEDLANRHVVLRDSGRGDSDDGVDDSRGRRDAPTGSSGAGGGDAGSVSKDGWLSWILDGEEGWVAVFTVIMGVLKVVLQALG